MPDARKIHIIPICLYTNTIVWKKGFFLQRMVLTITMFFALSLTDLILGYNFHCVTGTAIKHLYTQCNGPVFKRLSLEDQHMALIEKECHRQRERTSWYLHPHNPRGRNVVVPAFVLVLAYSV